MSPKTNIRSIKVSHTVTVDHDVPRGVTFTGIMNMPQLKERLQLPFTLPTASTLPLYKFFIDSQHVNCVGHYYEPPDDIAARKAATMDRSLENLLMSHLPSWAGIPDRETSAMLHTSLDTVGERLPGHVYRAIPANNSKLVVAPFPHIRLCFDHVLKAFGIADNASKPLHEVHVCFHDIFDACGLKARYTENWPMFQVALNDIASGKIRPQRPVAKEAQVALDTLIRKKSHVLDFLDMAFSPANNGFKVIDYNESINKVDYPDNEIWTASPCLFIAEDVLNDLR